MNKRCFCTLVYENLVLIQLTMFFFCILSYLAALCVGGSKYVPLIYVAMLRAATNAMRQTV